MSTYDESRKSALRAYHHRMTDWRNSQHDLTSKQIAVLRLIGVAMAVEADAAKEREAAEQDGGEETLADRLAETAEILFGAAAWLDGGRIAAGLGISEGGQ